MSQPQPNDNASSAPTPAPQPSATTPPRSETKKQAVPPASASTESPGPRSFSNPFLDSKTKSGTLLPAGLAPWHIVVLCLVLGLLMVGWRAKRRSDDAHARARTEAQARSAAVEAQFHQALSATEILGALVRQAGGAIPSFQKTATELLAARPALETLELQPGGVIADIVPRSGNERAIGFKVLGHPTYGPGASLVIQKRALSVEGPIPLYRGASGIIVREPIFVRGRDGREAFWGFVAVSLKLSDAFTRAHLDDLYRQGYSYLLFSPTAQGRKPLTLATHGAVSLSNAVQQPVRAHNAEFQLALQPRGGWVSTTKVVLEALAVVAGSGLLGLLLALLESRRAIEADLADKAERLASETKDRKQALDDCRTAKDELATIRVELTQSREALQGSTEQEVRLNAAVRSAEAAAQAQQAELDQARAAHQQAEQMIRSLQSRLADAAQAEKDTADAFQAKLQAAHAVTAELQARLEAESQRDQQPVSADFPSPPPPEIASTDPVASKSTSAPEASEHASDASIAPESETAHSADVAASTASQPSSAEQSLAPAPLPAEPKASRASRRKKAKPTNQMDLFAAPPLTVETEADAASESSASEHESLPDQSPAASTAHEAAIAPDLSAETTAEPPPNPSAEPEAKAGPKEVRRHRRLPAPPPVNPAQLRKAANQILPLFTGQDPGAWDCLRDNRDTFRSAFDPEDYAMFEQSVKKGEFESALEHLRKATRKHGINL